MFHIDSVLLLFQIKYSLCRRRMGLPWKFQFPHHQHPNPEVERRSKNVSDAWRRPGYNQISRWKQLHLRIGEEAAGKPLQPGVCGLDMHAKLTISFTGLTILQWREDLLLGQAGNQTIQMAMRIAETCLAQDLAGGNGMTCGAIWVQRIWSLPQLFFVRKRPIESSPHSNLCETRSRYCLIGSKLGIRLR